ncbi:glycosyltransferase [Kineosporia sp. NBRC 101731]|uniref:nucleotide disphospho-sugar-binding domain-containing protein n=1 Tax=Kineosporia sp. NBRC 101731 TaxID=3032199 RepID=UPI0025546DB7|nr:glycosyltransferase [Kineosporia sp. NBRC 101731]
MAVPPVRRDQADALGARVLLLPDPPEAAVAEVWSRVRSGQPASVDREIFAGLNTTAYLPVLERACREWEPDLVLHEAAEFAGAIAAHRCGIRHAQIAIGLAMVEAGALEGVTPVLEERAAGVVEAIRTSTYFTRLPGWLDPSSYPDTRRVRVDAGLGKLETLGQRETLVRRETLGQQEIPGQPENPGELETLGQRDALGSAETGPQVFVSFGTVVSSLPGAAEVYREALEALRDLPARAVLTTGGAGARLGLEPGRGLALEEIPPNVTVADWVDQDRMLAAASVVVCHGGAGTTFGALENGVPVVVVPFMADQPVNARIVTEAGAGLTVEPFADGPLRQRLRTAIETVLRQPSFHRKATDFARDTAKMPEIGSAGI